MMGRLLMNWDLAHWLRLLVAGVFLISAIASGDGAAYAASFFVALQAVFNFGCCGTGCTTGRQDDLPGVSEIDIEYKEVR